MCKDASGSCGVCTPQPCYDLKNKVLAPGHCPRLHKRKGKFKTPMLFKTFGLKVE
jgi:hypothetical protein